MGGVMILFSIIVTTLVMTEKFSDPTIKTYLLIICNSWIWNIRIFR